MHRPRPFFQVKMQAASSLSSVSLNILSFVPSFSKRLREPTNIIDRDNVQPSHGLNLYTTLSASRPKDLTRVSRTLTVAPSTSLFNSPKVAQAIPFPLTNPTNCGARTNGSLANTTPSSSHFFAKVTVSCRFVHSTEISKLPIANCRSRCRRQLASGIAYGPA